jgi:hypothetical protein
MSTPSRLLPASIPYDTAAELCEQIRQANQGKWYTFNGMWCWGCVTFTKGEVSKRCFNNTPDCRGCTQVTRRYGLAESN